MDCLGIPVDHRLQKIIQRLRVPSFFDESSHLVTLENFGRTLLYAENKQPISTDELNHGLELAGPGTKGGLLIALYQPPENQTFHNGYTADTSACRTTEAIRQLLLVSSGGQMTLDDISVFDTLPYYPEGSDDAELVKDAEHAFSQMVKLKAPDVVVCSYQSDSVEPLVSGLQSIGVGKVFKEPKLRITDDCTTTRVNAFHPSYAVNYQRSYSCFRRLLLLEYVKAFSHLSKERWEEEEWMSKLRSQCVNLAKKLYTYQKPRWPIIDENRWIAILTAIQLNFSNLDYFRSKLDSDIFLKKLVGNSLSWNCADASLFLAETEEKYADGPNKARIAQLLSGAAYG
ncbi:uncharacterized protein BO80DRAFT_443289 [Aspergillus ibericus CBS 121593]|uniref:Uncharacterized protein n=1 Tax=Aspergillus ibericus CBS 121593 TaxID=1448316 RepID=A0A395H5Z3_9EURO|nr:hypothetical protein BO80DRAFT_443289 [Aspergillus ibericus CBS 121593]RAL03040.1 hypothetical protein BO80DRAFT_443289 [Aspergillus ibericus CBS 121593]